MLVTSFVRHLDSEVHHKNVIAATALDLQRQHQSAGQQIDAPMPK